MACFIVSSARPAAAAGSGWPASVSAAVTASPVMSSMICSPTSGVCHWVASSCQRNTSLTAPSAITQLRSSSGRVVAIRWAKIDPQSWPTRSTGSPIASSWSISQSTYSCFVHPKPSGMASPNPGKRGQTTSSRVSRATTGSQNSGVSGTPGTRTAGTATPRRAARRDAPSRRRTPP